jgi:PAS domain S-box-containing protein
MVMALFLTMALSLNFNSTKLDMNEFTYIINLLQDSAHYYIICTNMAGNYSYVNNSYAGRFKYITDDFVGKQFSITMHNEDIAKCRESGMQCLVNRGTLVPVVLRKHDGQGGYIKTQWEFKGIFNDQGGPEGVFCLGYDITELARKEKLLVDIAFSQSHVIRRPVANILGIADILKQAGMPAETNDLLDMLLKSTTELDDIIRQIASDINRVQ